MADLPTGTVTFLFTDIEGSTRLLQQLGTSYAAVLEEHLRLLRAPIQSRGGQEVDTQGDALFAAFSSARTQLGEQAFSSTWNAGQAMTLEQAIEYALADPG